MSALSEKDVSILALIQKLERVSATSEWMVVDYWDADLCAIGLVRPEEPRRLVYISTHNQTPGRYYCECEEPAGAEMHEFRVVRRSDAIDFEELVDVIREHLRLKEAPKG